MPTADGAAAGGDEPFTAKADNFVPTFSGKQVDYKEFRWRCDIHAAKMRLAKRENETAFNIVMSLKGQAWDCMEDLSIEGFSTDTAYKTVGGDEYGLFIFNNSLIFLSWNASSSTPGS